VLKNETGGAKKKKASLREILHFFLRITHCYYKNIVLGVLALPSRNLHGFFFQFSAQIVL